MIYLFTGNMGAGKTPRVVSMILNNEDGLFKMELEDGTEADRPLYFCHIDGLDKRKFNARELAEGQIMSAPLRDVIPEGAVLIVGEAHYTYPVRAAGALYSGTDRTPPSRAYRHFDDAAPEPT